jgi:hypothetical protein
MEYLPSDFYGDFAHFNHGYTALMNEGTKRI